jgi:hypothetical protein
MATPRDSDLCTLYRKRCVGIDDMRCNRKNMIPKISRFLGSIRIRYNNSSNIQKESRV